MGDSRLRERLLELFEYNKETGEFVRKVSVQGFRCEAGMVAGSKDKHGYININVDGKKHKAHRLAWLIVHGRWPNPEVDHNNRIRDDNRLCNLEEVTSERNKWNTKIHSHNRSGVKGVSWDSNVQKWRASITAKNRFKHLGFFETLEEASVARSNAEKVVRCSDGRGTNWGLAG